MRLALCSFDKENKAMELIRPTKQTSLEESFQHLNILRLPKLYTLSANLCIFIETNSFQTILMSTLFQSAQFILPHKTIYF